MVTGADIGVLKLAFKLALRLVFDPWTLSEKHGDAEPRESSSTSGVERPDTGMSVNAASACAGSARSYKMLLYCLQCKVSVEDSASGSESSSY